MEAGSGKVRSHNRVKPTGIVRKLDELGRIVLPIELRRSLEISERDDIEIYVDGSDIILKKYRPACAFCHNETNVIPFKGKSICPRCLKGLRSLQTDEKTTAH